MSVAETALSYVCGPREPILEVTIDQAFRETVARCADRDALVVRHQNVRLTWRELDREVERTARGLAGLGLRRGDRIGVWSANCVEWILLQIGAARAGLILVNVNPAYRSHELRYVLQKSGIRAIFLHEKDNRANYAAILAESRNGDPLALEHVIFLGQDSWHRMVANPGILPENPGTQHDVANIQYTSGTTGSPKGVLLTHRNLVNNGKAISLALKATEQDRICAPVPLYHCFGCVIAVMVSVVTGAALILPSPQFDALATLEAIQAERATAIYGVPTMFIAELEHPEFSRFDLRSLRTGVMAGSPCPIEIMRRVATDMHCPEMTIAYGQTESSPVSTMSAVDDPLELRVATVGTALVNTEIKVVSRETGETVPVGEIGELCTRGYLVMKGYDGQPDATAEAVDRDGWLRTGDLAIMQPDGYFRIRGRAKDTIIRGGENIYPREVEEFLHHHPKISDVYVFGVPDRRLGETVGAWVRLKPGVEAAEDEIREFCRGTIAYFKIPQYIRFVDSFPMTVTNKVQKYIMRETEIRERGLEAAAMVATA
jgi:fatty-acyl-CoA synthase